MANNLATTLRRQVPTVQQALKALAAMERQLTTTKTYEEIRRIIKEASALKILLGHIEEVKAQAENTILAASIRIGEEIQKVKKATGLWQKSPRGEISGRIDTGVPRMSRSRLTKLANHGSTAAKRAAKELRAQGKDATPRAVVIHLTQGNKKERRDKRERELSTKILALPNKKYGLIATDDAWNTKVYSRETGMDRHAANHYPVEDAYTAEQMHTATKDRFQCAAKDCVLAMWTTSPHSAIAHKLMELRGFEYKSQVVWYKKRPGKGRGTGYWFINEHEVMLIGTRGNIPAPAPGTQWPSVIEAPVGKHSAKPEIFLQMLEEYFPNLPKIELNRRGKPRPGWKAWGNETELQEAAE